MTKIVKETLAEKVGIPTLTVDVDLLSWTLLPPPRRGLKTSIEGFLVPLSRGAASAASEVG